MITKVNQLSEHKPVDELLLLYGIDKEFDMIPKPVYELLPVAYVAGSIVALAVADHFIVILPVALLLLTAGYIIYLRYRFRHLTARERAVLMSQRFKSNSKSKYVRKRHHSF